MDLRNTVHSGANHLFQKKNQRQTLMNQRPQYTINTQNSNKRRLTGRPSTRLCYTKIAASADKLDSLVHD